MDVRPGALWRRARADLGRPERPLERELFLAGCSIAIVILAQSTKPGSTVELLVMTPAVVACVVRGLGLRMPAEAFALLVIVPVALVVTPDGHLEVSLFLPVLVTLYTSAYLGSRIRAVVIFVAAAMSPVLIVVVSPDADFTWAPWTAANVFTFALGLTLHRNREIITQLRAARDELAQQALGEERRRIARELHDLAGHTLAAVMLHVTGARHVLDRDPGEARRALNDAETVGRSSLDQIREVVAALRMNERGTDPSLAGAGDLDHLLDTYRRAGIRIDASLGGAVGELEGPAASAIHRITQESLANVARHAPGNSVSVVLDTGVEASGQRVAVLTITDSGTPPGKRDGGTKQFGLVGMRERARAVGGDLVAGPHAMGWSVRATVPLPAATAPDAASADAGEQFPHDVAGHVP